MSLAWPVSWLKLYLLYISSANKITNTQIKQIDLGCESAENWQLSSTSIIAIVIITQPIGWYSFYCPMKAGRLSRPKHCRKGAQPVLKTVYHSSCRDKHNCQRRDSNLDPLTPQSDVLTTRLLRPFNKTKNITKALKQLTEKSIITQVPHLLNALEFCYVGDWTATKEWVWSSWGGIEPLHLLWCCRRCTVPRLLIT